MKQPPEPKAPSAEQASQEETDARAYRVTLPMFEGPLDLLLHLIQKHELDILQIPIGFVAQKYLEYIRLMEDLSIDIASEYLVMAATLAYIKSRSLLPPDPTRGSDEEATDEEEEDPRAELIRKLLEYQKYKHAADNLGQRELLGRDVFARGFAPEHNEDEAPLAPMSLFKLMDAFEGLIKRAKQVQEHQIDFEKVSISDRIGQIVDRLRTSGTLSFVQLFDGDVTRVEMVVTFLALLEMTKLRITRLFQDGPLTPISVELALAPGELHEFEIQRKLGETPSVMQKIDSWDEHRVEIPAVVAPEAEEVALDEQSLANFELTPEELGEGNEWAQDLVFSEENTVASGTDDARLVDESDAAPDWANEPSVDAQHEWTDEEVAPSPPSIEPPSGATSLPPHADLLEADLLGATADEAVVDERPSGDVLVNDPGQGELEPLAERLPVDRAPTSQDAALPEPTVPDAAPIEQTAVTEESETPEDETEFVEATASAHRADAVDREASEGSRDVEHLPPRGNEEAPQRQEAVEPDERDVET